MQTYLQKNTLLSNRIFYLVIIALVILFFLFNFLPQKKIKVVQNSSWQTTIGTIIELSYSKYSNNKILFSDKAGADYERPIMWERYGLQIGDKFMMEYDPENPGENFIVYFHKPVFANIDTVGGQQVLNTIGKVERLYSSAISFDENKTFTISFSYSVNGIKHKRSQDLPPGFRDSFPNLKNGNNYNVGYLSQHPKRAIILLGNPQ